MLRRDPRWRSTLAFAERVEKKWWLWGNGVRLVILESPCRLLLETLVGYIKKIAALRQPNETITVVVPQFVPRRWWHQLLHAQTGVMLRLALINYPACAVEPRSSPRSRARRRT